MPAGETDDSQYHHVKTDKTFSAFEQQMYEPKDKVVQTLFRLMTEAEREYRKVKTANPGNFLNWTPHITEERKGSLCLISRTRQPAEKRQIIMKDIDNHLTIMADGKNLHQTPNNTLGTFLTSIICKRYIEMKNELLFTCDRLIEAINNPDSNYMIYVTFPYNNSLLRFMIASRHNLLPTQSSQYHHKSKNLQPSGSPTGLQMSYMRMQQKQ